jgi:plastocyanin
MNRVWLLSALLLSSTAFAADHVVSQSAKAFSTKSVSAKVGDTVTFKNEDPFAHNIFSLSDAQSFDLGTFSKGEARKVKLDKEGQVEVECAIHPDMKLKIEVSR